MYRPFSYWNEVLRCDHLFTTGDLINCHARTACDICMVETVYGTQAETDGWKISGTLADRPPCRGTMVTLKPESFFSSDSLIHSKVT